MCGIVGYVGKRNAKDVIMSGLARLEYRGYDSAGIALSSEEGQVTVLNKSRGRLSALESKIDGLDLLGQMALGHTRWATHGAPSDLNAHPHKYGRVVVVHNGIIENYLALKQELKEKGHSFSTATDTEVVAHLFDNLLNEGHDALKALWLLCERLEGSFALGFMIDGDSTRLYFAKRGTQPLIVAKNQDECFFASDQAALVDFGPSFYSLKNYETGYIERDRAEVFDLSGNPLSIEFKPLIAKLESIEKAGHKHFMHKEIFEQPETIRRVLSGRLKDDEINLPAFELDFNSLGTIKNIEIIACGSAYFAGLIAKPGLEERLGLPVTVEIASEYRYRKTLTNNQTLVIAISQSGETADTLAALEKAHLSGAHCMSVCNVVGSAIANKCQESIGNLFLHAGPEIAVASTKAFIAQVVALKLFAMAFAKHRGLLNEEEEKKNVQALIGLSAKVDDILALDDEISKVALNLVDEPRMLYLGRGELFAVALEGALKMKELSYIFAEGYPAGELKHGPIATIDEGMPAIVIFGHNTLAVKTASNLQEIKARGARVISIVPGHVDGVKDESDVVFDIGNCEAWLIPVLATIPLQLLAYHLAVHKGLDADKPRNLAKSVTVE